FFNNLGNGLLVYGTSHPQVANNRFERTGFGVSVVKYASITLSDNNFQGNRIGVIFEGNSQGILRDNKIFSSLEYGVVAIANSRLDLGTNEQSGGNLIRGSGKFDIQNVTKNSIVAVGTEVQGETAGSIDFRGTTNSLVAINPRISRPKTSNNSSVSRLRNTPLTPAPEPSANSALRIRPIPEKPTNNSQRRTTSNSAIASGETLPPPPSLPSYNNVASNNNIPRNLDNETTELVFSAPTDEIAENNLANNPTSISNIEPPRSSINSLGDVISFATPAATIKYRVLVETSNSSQQAQVRSLYPDAFRTVYQGKTMLQVGAFSQRDKADKASRSLANLGLISHVLE
ncbi:MAG: right-handed parallel beta-helix repeat-containing protein, partial [Cyanobacteria bacterium P01_F01_bin.143]